jgi:hypothetical protein
MRKPVLMKHATAEFHISRPGDSRWSMPARPSPAATYSPHMDRARWVGAVREKLLKLVASKAVPAAPPL